MEPHLLVCCHCEQWFVSVWLLIRGTLLGLEIFKGLCFKNFVVQTKFVKHKTLKYFESITQTLSIAKITSLTLLMSANL